MSRPPPALQLAVAPGDSPVSGFAGCQRPAAAAQLCVGHNDMIRRVLIALLLGAVVTAASYVLETGCSCGPAHGLPFAFQHPYGGCYASSGRVLVGAGDGARRFAPVWDLNALGYDILGWSALAFIGLAQFAKRRAQLGASPNGGPPEPLGNSDADGGPPSVS